MSTDNGLSAAMQLAGRAAKLTTPAVSDALDRLEIPGQVAGIGAVGGAHAVSGPAFTICYRPVRVVGETVGDFIDDVPKGSVVVVDNQGRLDCTVWGDILTETAHRQGVAGTVIDGLCRDAAACDDLGYPLFARSNWMRTGKDRVTIEAVGSPVRLNGVEVAPGDLVVGDRDGVVIVPAARADEVIALAESIESAEERIRAIVRAGSRLDEARGRAGYHELQRSQHGRPPSNGEHT